MAGGSTDAAAVLYALNELTGAQLSTDELAEIGEKIGADVPFCVYGGTMTASGIGTILSPITDMPECTIVIVMPEFRISTSEAYSESDKLGYENIKSMDYMTNSICGGNLRQISSGLYNRFEEVAGIKEIDDIKTAMKNCGALGALMTGSGSAVFGIFDDKDKAGDCEDKLQKQYDEVFVTHPVNTGPSRYVPGGIIGDLLG